MHAVTNSPEQKTAKPPFYSLEAFLGVLSWCKHKETTSMNSADH